MLILLTVVFLLGYAMIALEGPLKIDKTASALLTGTVLWGIFALHASGILGLGYSPSWEAVGQISDHIMQFIKPAIDDPTFNKLWAGYEELSSNTIDFVSRELNLSLVGIAQILFFLAGAMIIVETIDEHSGFELITDKIRTVSKMKLMWIISLLTFFMSAVLDNLTTTIVMVALLNKLIDSKKTRWYAASLIIISANAGGAWSPIGDVTTIMLWIGGQVTAANIITGVFLPSLVTVIVPLLLLSITVKGNVNRPTIENLKVKANTTPFESKLILIMGVGTLLLVPVIKTLTHLPPFMGMLFGLGIIWLTTEILHRNKSMEERGKLTVLGALKHTDMGIIFFFMGILLAVGLLEAVGILDIMSKYLNESFSSIYAINLIIGLMSSIIDNVPLVAGTMGMYPIADAETATGFMTSFVVDGKFWEFLAYCAGTGGSILIIGSAAGVAAMSLEKIDFIWYLKKISLLAIAGYLSGAAVYYIQMEVFGF